MEVGVSEGQGKEASRLSVWWAEPSSKVFVLLLCVLLLFIQTWPWWIHAGQRLRPLGIPADAHPAFHPGETTEPIAWPGVGDWLATAPEISMSFDDHVAQPPYVPNATRTKIYLRPVGEGLEDAQLKLYRSYVATFFGMPVEVLPTLDPGAHGVPRRVHPRTNKPQWNTVELMKVLGEGKPKDAFCVLGISRQDLWPGDNTSFVFGQASLEDGVGVFSFARHDSAFLGGAPDPPDVVLARDLKTMTHELGHIFSIDHCTLYRCNINGANSLEEGDRHPLHLCPVCLRKLHHAIKFDSVTRYQRLQRWYQDHALPQEAAWVERRLLEIKAPRALAAP